MTQKAKIVSFLKQVLNHQPAGWVDITTHRLDIYNEKLAKTQFLEYFENLYKDDVADAAALENLPTAYDYIRLGHPLSCVLEWAIAKQHGIDAENVISFASQTVPVLAVLRANLFHKKKTQINYLGELPESFNDQLIKEIYGYHFELNQVSNISEIKAFNGSTIFIAKKDKIDTVEMNPNVDFSISLHGRLGSILVINGEDNNDYVADIQHVRRRETVAMTPADSLTALHEFVGESIGVVDSNLENNKASVLESIKEITGTQITPLVGSSGLSVQYAIMMGLIHDAQENHHGKAIKFVVPPNCYGGTNDQARRVAACLDHIEIVDLPVDGENDMVQSIDRVLENIAQQDAIPYIIAEIPTNPRVEVPDLVKLKEVLSKERKTANGETAIDPVFILDQTFCPNVHFLGENKMLSTVRTIAYASGSKFPSGGRCTAGYCVGNNKTQRLMDKISLHLELCDNEATQLQYEILAEQLPSMNQRIADAYKNTREFVSFIEETLPSAKINFVSEELASEGFTPSVFSMDLPTQGATEEEKERYKRELNLKLINLMITEIPDESKFCVSYGQLKGCYWTIPATSTQGTTKEGDKDYIVRASLSPDLDLEKHKEVFQDFVNSI
ncbi:Cys/Met metabolism PLP-dependent enzyme [Nonlabens dokdonensis]|uniref:Monooxygenase family protein n=2 Tax=Nonlabens dokdonensis TaxID=328515 RepID=L7WE61_NONDD|nr:PLP-dependent transferase [Nonlabens dokdonensis]AGC78231.1 monooxygenase family protein [Nonlabens dokdonensis DSW-6]PZX37878.1 Cys/Met metabolism PLP-dependent enzyme [Nonlabens dokdonensis]